MYRQGLVQPGPTEVRLLSETERDTLLQSPRHAITAKFIASKQSDDKSETAAAETARKRIWPMFIGNLPPKSTATNLINFLVKVLRDTHAANDVSQRLDRELRDEDLRQEIICIRGRHEVFRPNEENADGKTLFNDFVFVDLATESARDTLVATLPGLRWFGKKLKADNGVLKKNKFEDKFDDNVGDKVNKDKFDMKPLKKTARDDGQDDKTSNFVRDKESKSRDNQTNKRQLSATNDKKRVISEDIDDFRNDLDDNDDTVSSRDTNSDKNQSHNRENVIATNEKEDKNVFKTTKIGKIDNLANIDDFLFSGDDEDAYDTEKDRATQARSKETSVVKSATNVSSTSRTNTNGDKRQASATSKKVTLFVGNLSFDTDSDDLAQFARDTLSQTTVAATVSDCRIVTDKFSGRKRGFGYIDLCLDDTVDANRVVVPLFQDTRLQGRHLKIDLADEHHSR